MRRPDDSDADSRRLARAGWPVKLKRLDECDDDLSDETTPTERIAMMWPLAQEAWRLAGRESPIYDRAHTPCRVLRPGQARPDDTDS